MTLWRLNYYPDQDGVHPDPKDPERRAVDIGFLVSCDAECKNCGQIQHPPEGGDCPQCQQNGTIDYENINTIRD